MEPAKREFVFKDSDFRFISRLVTEKTGIVIADHKKNMVYSRIARRLRALDLKTFKQYCEYVATPDGDKEMINFVNAITTNVTNFFRENHHFEHLREEVFQPMVAKPPPGKRLRVWSAGCSSGMETYSIAMTLCEAMSNIETWNAKILATDIDTNMLDKGRNGIYESKILDSIPKSLQKKYVVGSSKKGAETVSMADKLKKLIAFKQLNLLENWPLRGPFDVIFCRNVVIYFNKDTQRVIFDKYANLLKPGGWLYIGHSENLFNVCDRFESMGNTIYRKIK